MNNQEPIRPEIKYKDSNPVFVVDKNEKPMNPYFDKGFVRKLLKSGEAKIYKRDPFFTIQMVNHKRGKVEKYLAGMDTGGTIGVSVIDSNLKEILSAEFQTRSHEIKKFLNSKAKYRRNRRSRLRYRKKRFQNRKSSKGTCKVCGGNLPSSQKSKGKIHEICNACLKKVDGNHHAYKDVIKRLEYYRIAPSVRHKIDTHLKIIKEVETVLPIKKWTIEKTKFDIQKIENVEIKGVQYQQGQMFGFSNIREYVLYRDKHTCQNPKCKNKAKKPILNVHHIRFQVNGGTDKPNNLITLCDKCHTNSKHNSGILYEWDKNRETAKSIKEGKGGKYKDQSSMPHMGIIYKHIINSKNNVEDTYGYVTKRTRQIAKLEKSHVNDAYVLALKPLLNKIFIDEKKGFKKNIIFEKILNYTEIIQARRSRRSLETLTDAQYIEKVTGEKKSCRVLSKGKEEDKKTKEIIFYNNRLKRQERAKSKGKFIKGKARKRQGKPVVSKHEIAIVPHPKNKNIKMIKELGGKIGDSSYVFNYNGKYRGTKAISLIESICKRQGFVKKLN